MDGIYEWELLGDHFKLFFQVSVSLLQLVQLGLEGKKSTTNYHQ